MTQLTVTQENKGLMLLLLSLGIITWMHDTKYAIESINKICTGNVKSIAFMTTEM